MIKAGLNVLIFWWYCGSMFATNPHSFVLCLLRWRSCIDGNLSSLSKLLTSFIYVVCTHAYTNYSTSRFSRLINNYTTYSLLKILKRASWKFCFPRLIPPPQNQIFFCFRRRVIDWVGKYCLLIILFQKTNTSSPFLSARLPGDHSIIYPELKACQERKLEANKGKKELRFVFL